MIWDELRYFRADEPGIAPYADKLSSDLLRVLDAARHEAGMPFSISSAYRPDDSGAHGRGLAVDIRCSGSIQRMAIVRALLNQGVPRVGVYDKHIHADVDPTLPQGMWAGTSS